jgi:four helix bundle protein
MKKSFRDLYVWTASVQVAVRIVPICDGLIARRHFALAHQILRAAISVPSNIAEGYGRLTPRDRRHFVSQARGSLYELQTQLEIAERACLIPADAQLNADLRKIGSGLTHLIETFEV